MKTQLVCLKLLLETMNVPKSRRELNQNNFSWLLRNLGLNNRHHPNLEAAIFIIAEDSRNRVSSQLLIFSHNLLEETRFLNYRSRPRNRVSSQRQKPGFFS